MSFKTEENLKKTRLFKIIEQTLSQNDGLCLDNEMEVDKISLILTKVLLRSFDVHEVLS